MASGYKAYPEYKYSGVEWLGDVPIHWNIKRLGQFFEERREKVSDKDYPPLSVTMKGIVPQLDNAAKSDAGDNRKLVLKNDFVINSRSDRKGSSGTSPLDGSVSLISIVMEPKRINPKFAHHLLRSYPFQEEFYRYGKGIVADLWSTNSSEMKNILLPEIGDEESKAIANFLDYETAKIDTLIEKQQLLIKLLKEKRQAVISHAVTKGLNPQAPMKDSGVEWLDEVPAHWQIVPLKYLCTFSGGGTPTKDNLSYWTNGSVPWVSPKDMKSFWIDKTQDYVTERAVKESSTNFVDEGALLMVVRSGILQRTIPIAINTVPVTMNQDMKALKFNDRIDVQYAAGFILGSVNSLLLDWSKDGATVESIEYEYLSNGLFPVPPKQEQQAIISFINKQQSAFQMLEDKAVLGIKLLSERRTALISAAVTGKIDVRNWEQPND
ncbi:MAG: restriction endonuclease subunit S [Pseudoalteromonas distincta]|uniref:restriction endonuclease subunit S n=1 Tax=Pseudoalteromonas distincta TaxID=77608 RepID=UPI003F98A391